MKTPVQMFITWLTEYVSIAGYKTERGMWVEDAAKPKDKYLCLWVDQGRSPLMDIQYPTIRIIVTGTRNGRSLGETESVEMFAHGIIEAAEENYRSDCIAQVRSLGAIQGPYYTEVGRPWYEINFELTI